MAILTKAQLEALNQSSFPDQSTEAITPAILRNYNTQTIDTLVDSLDTGSFVTSAITASSLITASVNLNTITFTKGNGTTFAVTVNTGSGGGTTDLTSLNAYTASQDTKNLAVGYSTSSINSATSSLFTSASLGLTTASFSGNTLTFRKGDNTTFGIVIPDVSGSGVPTGTVSSSAQIVGLGFLQTSSFNTYTASNDTKWNTLGGQTGSYITSAQTSSMSVLSASFAVSASNVYVQNTSANQTHLVTFTDATNSYGGLQSTNAFIYNPNTNLLTTTASVAITLVNGTGSLDNTSLNDYTASNDTKWNTLQTTTASFSASVASISALTGSYATTGSNLFIGDQTLSDGSGNNSTISSYSGSLVLVAKTYASSSAALSHISSSVGFVNIIFKSSNTNTGSFTLSGSGNICVTPAIPTTGFRRQVGSNNVMLTGNQPEVTGSLTTYTPNISSNYATNIIRFRGPASSSAWAITNNIVNGNFNIGNADATSANQAVAGGNITTNLLLAAVNYNAYTTPLVAQAVFQSNLSVGNSTLTAFSSSIAANNNIFVGNTFTVNNSYFGTASTAAAQRLSLANNVFGGINTPTLTASGSNTSAAAPREVSGNTTNGAGLAIGVVLNGDNSNLYSTLIHGSNLTVTGSNAYNTQASAGSTFIGRNNSVNGTAARSGETIFAVGTGTGTGARKTGFLIDSGSNVFVEGTLSISGSTSITGAVNITGSTYISGGLNISGGVYSTPYALTITSQTASIDTTLASTYTLTLVSGSTTHIALSGQKVGQTYNLLITQPASGTGSIQMGPFIYQPSGSSYVPTPTSNAEDILTFVTFNNTAKTYIANVTNFI